MITGTLPESAADSRALPAGLPSVIDAHVHLFPDRLFDAVWRWFDTHGWLIRYKLYSREVIDTLLARGVERIVALHYAHKPGVREILANGRDQVTPSTTPEWVSPAHANVRGPAHYH